MATGKCKSEESIATLERRLTVGYRPNKGNTSIPMVSFSGRWLLKAGFEPGTGISLKVMNGCLVLIPDSREEKRLQTLKEELSQQRLALEQTRQQIKALI